MVSETGSALRATSDALLADLDSLEALEREKRELPPEDPRLVGHAERVEEIARRLLGESVRQRELSALANEQARRGDAGAPSTSIEDTTREIHQILADWRDAERRAQEATAGSAEADRASADVIRFRDEYRQAHERARRRR